MAQNYDPLPPNGPIWRVGTQTRAGLGPYKTVCTANRTGSRPTIMVTRMPRSAHPPVNVIWDACKSYSPTSPSRILECLHESSPRVMKLRVELDKCDDHGVS